MKRLLTSSVLILFSFAIAAGAESDTLDVAAAKRPVNDYSMLGFSYGGTFRNCYFNPTKTGNVFKYTPDHFSLTYTHYHKMFGYLPYFGVQVGLNYGKEGFSFEYNDKGQPRGHQDGATDCVIEVVEIPAMAHFHIDFSNVKAMANLGIYGGYKLSIDRDGPFLKPEYRNRFFDYEKRFDFGLQGGVGLGLMFDPIELHLNATLRWGWQNMTTPDSNPFSQYPKYYYRFAYPLDLIVTVGVHYQLTKRQGRTTREIKKEAYEKVYGTTENP